MRQFLKMASIICAALLVVFIINCAVNPVTGKKELMLVSRDMELDMGRSIDRALRLEYGFYNDPNLRAYVKSVGERLVPYVHRQEIQYRFEILDTPVENAFAAPGGYIYITRGLLAMLNSEAELATVLGHELGHVNARHSARQISRQLLITMGIMVLGELNEDIRKITPVSMIAAQLLFLKYSRSDEYQADELGIQYAQMAGYDAERMVDFFTSLERLSNIQGGGHIPNFLSTHPLTPNRIVKIKELLQTPLTDPKTQQPIRLTQPPVIARNIYLKNINGLIFGDDPRQGYLQGNTFYHTSMRFAFDLPYGWKCVNTPMQVTMSTKDGNAVMVLKAESNWDPLDKYVQDQRSDLKNLRLINEGFLEVNGLDAFATDCALQPETDENGNPKGEEIAVNISSIRKEDMVFTFFAAASSSHYHRYQSTMERSITSFRHLRDLNRHQRRPARINIRHIRRDTSLSAFLNSLRIPARFHQSIGIINNLSPNQLLKAQQSLKIIQ